MLLCILVSWRLQQYSGAGSAKLCVSASELYGASARCPLLVLLHCLGRYSTVLRCAEPALLFLVSYTPLAHAPNFSLGGLSRSQGACFGGFESGSCSFEPSSRTVAKPALVI